MSVTYVTQDKSDKRFYDGVIASGGTKSEVFDIGGGIPCAVKAAATMTGTAVSFEKSVDGNSFGAILDPDTGADYSVTIAAGKWTPLDIRKFWGTRFLKIVSNAAEGGARTMGLETIPS